MKRALLLFLIIINLPGYGQTKSALFIGNSYTSYNNLPQIVADLASSAGATLVYQYNAPGGYTLEQHSSNSTTLGLIRSGSWNYVILQEFSQYPSEPLATVESNVYPYARYLNSEIKANNPGVKTMFYMTWGRRDGDVDRCARLPEVCTYIGMDDLTRERYMYMAQDNQAEVSPVGAVWRYIRQNYPSIELYLSDGSHPTEAGSYIAACCFYTAIFRSDPTHLSYNFTLNPGDASIIRQAAKTVVFDNLSNWFIGNYDTPDTEAPTAPTGLTYSNLSQSGLTLNWNVSSDNIGVTGYYVYKNGILEKSVSNTTAGITGLDASASYTFTVRARDAAGNISSSSSSLFITTPDTQAPTVPTGFTSGNLTETGFTLGWLASTDNVSVTGYEVYQNGNYVTAVSGTSAIITGLSASNTYAMTVRAGDASGNYSAVSIIFNVTTPDTHAPTVPSGLVSENITQSSLTLNWNASADNVGVTGYDVYRDGIFVATVTQNTIGIVGLSPGTTYAMTVRAKDGAGNISSTSTVLNVITLAAVIPDTQAPTVPSGLSSGNISQTSFTLSWSASTDNTGVTGYEVYVNGGSPTTVTGTSASITGLSAGVTYAMTVKAKDAAGNVSASSNMLNVTTLNAIITDNQAPTVPSGLAASNITQTGFTLNWTASSDNVGVTGYDVYLNGLLITTVSVSTANISGLTGSTLYAVTVKAEDAAENASELSVPLNVTTLDVIIPDTEAPSIPAGLTSANITESGFTLNWNASTDNIGVTGYDILLNGTHITTVSATSVTLTDLNPSTTYAMTVKAKDIAGNTSAASPALQVTTLSIILPDTQAPSVPIGLTSGNITETSFTLTWNASSDDVGVTGYDIYQNGFLLTSVAALTESITGLSAGTAYSMTVRARDAANNISSSSSVLHVTTADTHAPGTPTGLSRTNLTQSSFTLNWTASNDNVGVTAYEVYRNGTLLTTVAATSANVTGLSASTSYSMSVKAKDAAGNISSASTILVVTTPDTQAPNAPTGLTATNLSQSSFTLSWTSSSDNVGVTGYDVYQNGIFLETVTATTVGISGLSAYTSYAMTVRAKDAAGNISVSSAVLNVTTLDVMAPTVPTGLTSGNLTQSGFTLYWTASTDNVGVTGYYVLQNGTQVTSVSGTSASISGLSASTIYAMTVKARDAAGNISSSSIALNVKTPDTQAPTVPTGLASSNLTQTSFTLTWKASADNVSVVGYEVYRNGVLVTTVAGTAAGISGLSVSVTYAMTVKAKDAAGNTSAASGVLNVTTPDTEGPTAPSGLTYSNLTQSGLTLNWNASTDNVGVTGYEVYNENVLLKAVTGTTTVLTGLAAATKYTLTVRARDASGNFSAPSTVLTITTPDTQAPTAPTGLNYNNLTQSGFNLKWTASTDNVGVHSYSVYLNGVLDTTVKGTSAFINGLAASRMYIMTVKAEDAAGNISTASAGLNVTTPDTEAPTPPAGLTSENITDTSFTLTWNAASDNVGVYGYDVYRNGTKVAVSLDTVAGISDLATFTSYRMTVKARDAAGNISAFSDVLVVHTLDIKPPSPPEGILVSLITDSSFTASWIPSEDNVGVLEYQVYRNGILTETTSDTVAAFTGLTSSTMYLVTVIAIDTAGNSSPSSTAVQVLTPDTQLPDAPSDIKADNITNKSFRLEWKASGDNVGVVAYNVYKNDTLFTNVADTMAIISGLTANTLYVMYARALDAAGNVSGCSKYVEITTISPDNTHGIVVYPNPIRENSFNIDLGMEEFGNTTIEILDLNGKLLYKLMVNGTQRIIKISDYDLERGIYFLRVSCAERVYNRKIIVDTQ